MLSDAFADLIAALREGRRAAKRVGAPKPTRRLLKHLGEGLAALDDTPEIFQRALHALLLSGVPNGFGYVVGAVAPRGSAAQWGACSPGLVPGTVYGDDALDALTKLADVLRHQEAKPNTVAGLSVETLRHLITIFANGAREVLDDHPNGRRRLALALRAVDEGFGALTAEERLLASATAGAIAPRETRDPGNVTAYRGIMYMPIGELRRFTSAILDAADDALSGRETRAATADPRDAFVAHAVRRLHTAALIAFGKENVSAEARAELYRATPNFPPPTTTWQERATLLCAAGPSVQLVWSAPRRAWMFSGLTMVNGTTLSNNFSGLRVDRLVDDVYGLALNMPKGAYFEVTADDGVVRKVRLAPPKAGAEEAAYTWIECP